MTTAESIILIGLLIVGLILTISVYIWKHITLGMAGAVYWVIIGLYTIILSDGSLLTLQGGIGLFELVAGIMTGTLPFVLKKKPENPEEPSRAESLEIRLNQYGSGKDWKKNIRKPWFTDDE